MPHHLQLWQNNACCIAQPHSYYHQATNHSVTKAARLLALRFDSRVGWKMKTGEQRPRRKLSLDGFPLVIRLHEDLAKIVLEAIWSRDFRCLIHLVSLPSQKSLEYLLQPLPLWTPSLVFQHSHVTNSNHDAKEFDEAYLRSLFSNMLSLSSGKLWCPGSWEKKRYARRRISKSRQACILSL